MTGKACGPMGGSKKGGAAKPMPAPKPPYGGKKGGK